MGILLNPDEKKMSVGFVKNFNVDVLHLENFIKNDVSDVTLGDCFGELRQTVNLLLSENYEEYLNSGVRKKLYGRVSSRNVLVLLEKLKHDGGIFARGTSEEKAVRKSIEKVLASVKEIGAFF